MATGSSGSSLVFTTGIEDINVTCVRPIDRWRINTICFEYLADRILARFDKGYLDPDAGGAEAFISIPGQLVIQDYSEDTAVTYNSTSYTVPSGTYFSDLFGLITTGAELCEEIEEGVFDTLEAMGIVSGTEVPD